MAKDPLDNLFDDEDLSAKQEDVVFSDPKVKSKIDDSLDNLFDDETPQETEKIETSNKFDNSFRAWTDRLVRGQYASANLIRGIVKDYKDLTPDEMDKKRRTLATPFIGQIEAVKDIVKNKDKIWKGLTGEEKESFFNVLTDVGWEDTTSTGVNFLKEIVGLGLDIGMDPTTYIAAPALRQAGRGVNYIAKQAKKIPAVEKGVTRAVEFAEPVTSTLKKAFINSTGNKQLDEVVETWTLGRENLKKKAYDFGARIVKQIRNVSKKSGKAIDDLSKEVVDIIEQPSVYSSSIPEINTIAHTLKSRFQTILTAEMKDGVPISALSNAARREIPVMQKELNTILSKQTPITIAETELANKLTTKIKQLRSQQALEYFPRITKDEVKKYLKSSHIGGAKVWNPKLSAAMKRKTGDFTLNEFNEFAKTNGIASLGGNTVEEFFMTNPAYATATREIGSAKARTSIGFLKESAETFGQSIKTAPEGWIEAPEALQKILPAFKNKKFMPEVIDEINRAYTKVFDPKEMWRVSKLFDRVQNWWKATTLAIFPSFHIRNAVGNVWNNYLAGVTSPKVYSQALKLQTLSRNLGKKATTFIGDKLNAKTLKELNLTTAEADVIRSAEKLGVLNRGWYGADIPQTIDSALTPGKIFVPSVEHIAIKGGRKLGSFVENNARLAHYIDKLQKGLPPEDAARSVKKFLFDYGDLTWFEKKTMKRLFPFYTWTRKNLPLQLEQAIKQPAKFIGVEKARRSLAQGELPDKKELEGIEWLKEGYPIQIGKTKMVNGKRIAKYMKGEGLIPAADMTKLFRPWELLEEQLTPIAKLPVELFSTKRGINFWTEREIESYKGQTKKFLGLNLPAKTVHVLRNFRILSMLDRMFRSTKDDETALSPGEKLFTFFGPATIRKVDLDESANWYRLRIRHDFNLAKRDIRRAYENNDPKRAKAIEKTLEQMIDTLKEFDTVEPTSPLRLDRAPQEIEDLKEEGKLIVAENKERSRDEIRGRLFRQDEIKKRLAA